MNWVREGKDQFQSQKETTSPGLALASSIQQLFTKDKTLKDG